MRLYVPSFPKNGKILVRLVAIMLPILCIFAALSQTVHAENTYVITDGDQVTVYNTYETDPAAVLTEAGVALSADDLYTTAVNDGVSEITIQRLQTITVYDRGNPIQATSYGETLDELLSRLGVNAYGDYKVSLPMDTVTFDGMEVSVDHILEQQQTYTVDIPFETTYCDDPSLPVGTQQVVVEGVAGQMTITDRVTFVNAQESSRVNLSQEVVAESVNAIVAVGTGTEETLDENAFAIGDGIIITPEGEILTFDKAEQFKTTAYNHTDAGCDMITATGTTVRLGTVAVDPTVIPYGTRMFIVSNDGAYIYGIATAEDCGGGVKGNHIDLYFPTVDECWEYGVRSATVYFLT